MWFILLCLCCLLGTTSYLGHLLCEQYTAKIQPANGNWFSEILWTLPSILMSKARYQALNAMLLTLKLPQKVPGEWFALCLSRSLEMGCVGKEEREVKCWMKLMGCVYPCLLEVAAEKVMEVRLPSWSELSPVWNISMGGKNWLWGTCTFAVVLVKEKRTVFRAIGCVSTFRQRRMSNEDFINTSFKIWTVGSQCMSGDTLQVWKKSWF